MKKIKIAVFNCCKADAGRHDGSFAYCITQSEAVYVDAEEHIPHFQKEKIEKYEKGSVYYDWEDSKKGFNYEIFSKKDTNHIVSILGENFEPCQSEEEAIKLKDAAIKRTFYGNYNHQNNTKQKRKCLWDIGNDYCDSLEQWLRNINSGIKWYKPLWEETQNTKNDVNQDFIVEISRAQKKYLSAMKDYIMQFYYPDVKIQVVLLNTDALLSFLQAHSDHINSFIKDFDKNFIKTRRLSFVLNPIDNNVGMLLEDWYKNIFKEKNEIFIRTEIFLLDLAKLLNDKEYEEYLRAEGYLNTSI